MGVGLKIRDVEGFTFRNRREPAFVTVAFGVVVDIFDIGPAKPGVGEDRPTRGKLGQLAGGRSAVDLDDDCLTDRIVHLRSDRALPNEFVDTRFGSRKLPRDLLGGLEALTRRTNGFVGFLRILDLVRELTRAVGQELDRKSVV